jgi:hypothetical protein
MFRELHRGQGWAFLLRSWLFPLLRTILSLPVE